MIFVQIASYRDPQLIPTINDLLQKSKNPTDIKFGICWQYGPDENPDTFDGNDNFRVMKIPYSESKGLGWARSMTNQLYGGEEYTLQIDSHHRFAPAWDEMLLDDFHQALLSSDNPIITTYCTPFEVNKVDELHHIPCYMSQYEFSNDKLLMSRPHYIQDYLKRKHVIRARTISAHFLFTFGHFITTVPYDPEIYFGGYTEETTISIRAFTHGYDFFSPYRQYIWHEYTRNYRVKHWDDHRNFGDADKLSRRKTRMLLGVEKDTLSVKTSKHGLGNKRTLQEYEAYIGIRFKECLIDPYTLDAKEPPNPNVWDVDVERRSYKIKCVWDVDLIKNNNLDEIDFIALGIEDKFGECLFRVDFTKANMPQYCNFEDNEYVCELESHKIPHKWILWPHFATNGWGMMQEKEV